MKILNKFMALLLIILMQFVFLSPQSVFAAITRVDLLTADNFAILAGSTITNTGPTTITGDIGLHPGTAFTGQAEVTLNGALHLTDATALQAKTDLVTAYNDAAGRTTPTRIATELGDVTLTAGVYDSEAGTFAIAGAKTLTLNGQGNADAVFIFQMESTLITEASSKVVLTNSAQACNVYWQVGSSATIKTSSDFVGNILAMESITLNTSAKVTGRVLARTSAVTLDTNTITKSTCAAGTAGGSSPRQFILFFYRQHNCRLTPSR